VSSTVAFLISAEMGCTHALWLSSLATAGKRSLVAVIPVEPIVDGTVKIRWAVKPRTGSDEYATREPLRPIVSSWSALIRRHIVIAIGACGGNSDVYAYLRSRRMRLNCQRTAGRQGGYGKYFESIHDRSCFDSHSQQFLLACQTNRVAHAGNLL
jgi:hypothetical protein